MMFDTYSLLRSHSGILRKTRLLSIGSTTDFCRSSDAAHNRTRTSWKHMYWTYREGRVAQPWTPRLSIPYRQNETNVTPANNASTAESSKESKSSNTARPRPRQMALPPFGSAGTGSSGIPDDVYEQCGACSEKSPLIPGTSSRASIHIPNKRITKNQAHKLEEDSGPALD